MTDGWELGTVEAIETVMIKNCKRIRNEYISRKMSHTKIEERQKWNNFKQNKEQTVHKIRQLIKKKKRYI